MRWHDFRWHELDLSRSLQFGRYQGQADMGGNPISAANDNPSWTSAVRRRV